jgi:serine/threonine protein kinase
MNSLRELLEQHERGVLPLELLRTRVLALAQANTAQLQSWVNEVQAELTAGRISIGTARSVLDMLTAADSQTQVASDRSGSLQATLIRPSIRVPERANTSPHDEDATRAIARSSQPPAIDDEDATERKRIDPTLISADSTLRKSGADRDSTQREASNFAADPTIRIAQPASGTAARTLRLGNAAMPDAANEPVDHTRLITERLVKSLDDVDAPHRGPLQPGSILKKRFVLEKLIGKGGMGLVFSALDRRKEEASDPNPRIALKILNADFQRHPQSLIALQREARKAQTLAHPNVVTVFDFDRDGDAVYMTMELLKGRALEAFVREGRGKGIDPKIALPIIRGIAEGLAYAHRKGIVHSDLKPGNVFVLDDGTPKILDFGIARAVPNANSDEAPDVFDAGMLGAYTEAYATDEMVDGVDPHPADDMYALGIISYELLTGFHPYQRHSAPKARELAVKPPPLKGLKLREARALERCLSFDRKQRPQSAAEFLKSFRGVTRLQQATLAATVVLTLTAGYFSYQNYRETSPAVPFSALPIGTQEEFVQHMQEGDQEWTFYRREQNVVALQGAISQYADAYRLHPRNRDAVQALNKAADAWLATFDKDPQQRREVAIQLQNISEHFRRYGPVVDAAD